MWCCRSVYACVWVCIWEKSVQHKPNAALPHACVHAKKTHQHSWRAAHQLSRLYIPTSNSIQTKQSTDEQRMNTRAHLPCRKRIEPQRNEPIFMLASMPFENEKANYLKIRLNNACQHVIYLEINTEVKRYHNGILPPILYIYNWELWDENEKETIAMTWLSICTIQCWNDKRTSSLSVFHF